MTPEDLSQDAPKSKSQIKRDMLALRALGERLTGLTLQQLESIPLDDNLRQAIVAAKKITSHGAKRRQLQYIGRLMRALDAAPIEQALANLHKQDQQSNAHFHRLERYRDELIAQGDAAIPAILTVFPTASRQILRQFIRKAHREKVENKTDAARQLFRYLRDLTNES